MEKVRNKRDIIIILLVGILVIQSVGVKEVVGKTEQVVSVTIPMTVPIHVDRHGSITTETYLSVENKGASSLEIQTIKIEVKGGWSIAEYGKDYTKEKVNLKEFGIKINKEEVPRTGEIAIGYILKPQERYPIEYDVTIAVQTESIEKESIATVIYQISISEVYEDLEIRKSEIKIKENEYRNKDTIIGVILEGSYIEISEGAFTNAKNIEYVKIRSSEISIDRHAFRGCTAIEVIEIEGSEIDIDERAFADLPNLKTLKIRGEYIEIGESAFRRNSSLSSIEIQGKEIEVGKNAYRDCETLVDVSIKGRDIYRGGGFRWYH